MPKTAYSQRFKRELDPEQLLSLLGYDLQSDPDFKNLSEKLRDEIHCDVVCPQCGVGGAVIVSRSNSKKTNKALRQPHFRFLAGDNNNAHHPLCDHYDDDSSSKSQREQLIDFGNDRSFETKIIRELVAKGIEQKIISQQIIRDMRQWFFDTKISNQFTMDISEEALQWTYEISSLFHHRGIPFKPIHAELPNFDWRHAAILQFVEENSNLINIVRTRWWGYEKKIEQRALSFVRQTQGKTVFNVLALENQYKKTIELSCFIVRNLRIVERNLYFFEQHLRLSIKESTVSAFAAVLLYISNWDVEAAISKLVAIVQAPTPTDMNAGNVIGLNPFHDFAAWANIMKAKEVVQYSPNGFNLDAQIEAIEQRLKEQYEDWKAAKS